MVSFVLFFNDFVQAVNDFLDKFFEQNPIAQVGLIVCKDKRAERLVSLSGFAFFLSSICYCNALLFLSLPPVTCYFLGNIRHLKDALDAIPEVQCVGDFSLQNCLRLGLTNLK